MSKGTQMEKTQFVGEEHQDAQESLEFRGVCLSQLGLLKKIP